MSNYISSVIGYYQGARISSDDLEVPPRPNQFFVFQQGEWVLDQAALLAVKIKTMDDAIRDRLNAQAALLEFADMAGAIGAASLPEGEFRQNDGAKLHIWAARTWQKAKEIRDDFLSGARPEPTWEEVESELPVYPIE